MLQTKPAPNTGPATDQRMSVILDGVRQAFAEKGFDGASMQDLARACGMSVGNFYRYFPSKGAIVAALVTRDLQQIEDQFRTIVASDDPRAVLRAALRARISNNECHDDGQIWAEITAAALRKPEIGAVVEQMETEIAFYLTEVFARIYDVPLAEAQRKFMAHATLIMMMVKSRAMCRCENPMLSHDLNELVLRNIDRVLDDMAQETLKG